jgi:hypothetical protein
MGKTVLVSRIITVCLFLGIVTGAFGGIAPSPFVPIGQDLKLFQQEIDPSKGKLSEAKPGANLTKLGLMKSHENMMGLLQSIQTKVKGLQETKGQEKGVLDICNKIKLKLDSLELFLKNFKEAITQGDRLAAQKRLNEIGDTVKELEALIAK